jgi:hypothetical protein
LFASLLLKGCHDPKYEDVGPITPRWDLRSWNNQAAIAIVSRYRPQYAGLMTKPIDVFTACLFAALASAAWAQDGQLGAGDQPPPSLFKGTAKEQAACSSDAARFCSDDIPDTFKVLACLQKHREKLRKACREVLKAHGE